jgi:hypothetical protein
LRKLPVARSIAEDESNPATYGFCFIIIFL